MVPRNAQSPNESSRTRVTLLCGPPGSGKTTTARNVVSAARRAGIGVGGFLARGIMVGERKVGFDLDLLDLDTRVPLCRAMDVPLGPAKVDLEFEGGPRVGHFLFLEQGLEAGGAALRRAMRSPPHVVVVDEVGFLELAGGGWDPWLAQLLPKPPCPVLAIVRDELEAAVRDRYGIGEARRSTAGDSLVLADLMEQD